MIRALRWLVLGSASACLLAPSAAAQSIFDSELRLAPQFQQYTLKAPLDEQISQFVLPVFVTVPVTSRFTMDVGTAYASSKVTSSTYGVSEISGLTDTQVRGNLTLGSDFIVLTAGLNLPTGQRSVALDQFTAASRIGSDFLSFPISNMGTGFALTGGIVVAHPVGDWSVGGGVAVRRSQSYEPFNIPGASLEFQPGNEYRLRIGADRPVRDGRLAVGLTYSAFGEDDAGGTHYNVGNRVIGQSVYSTLVSGTNLTVGAFDVFRMAGHYASGDPSGHDNILNAFASAGFHPGGHLVEPTIELRHWRQEVAMPDRATGLIAWRTQGSLLGSLGLRTRLTAGSVAVYPGVGYTIGSLATVDAAGAPATAGLTGFKAQIAMRATPFGQ